MVRHTQAEKQDAIDRILKCIKTLTAYPCCYSAAFENYFLSAEDYKDYSGETFTDAKRLVIEDLAEYYGVRYRLVEFALEGRDKSLRILMDR